MRLVQVVFVAAAVLVFGPDARADVALTSLNANATSPSSSTKRKRDRAKEEDARRACREKCERRNRNRDCAGPDGRMMPCPCHCD